MHYNGDALVHAAWIHRPQLGFLAFDRSPPVYPNTVDRYVFASFTDGPSGWILQLSRATP